MRSGAELEAKGDRAAPALCTCVRGCAFRDCGVREGGLPPGSAVIVMFILAPMTATPGQKVPTGGSAKPSAFV